MSQRPWLTVRVVVTRPLPSPPGEGGPRGSEPPLGHSRAHARHALRRLSLATPVVEAPPLPPPPRGGTPLPHPRDATDAGLHAGRAVKTPETPSRPGGSLPTSPPMDPLAAPWQPPGSPWQPYACGLVIPCHRGLVVWGTTGPLTRHAPCRPYRLLSDASLRGWRPLGPAHAGEARGHGPADWSPPAPGAEARAPPITLPACPPRV